MADRDSDPRVLPIYHGMVTLELEPFEVFVGFEVFWDVFAFDIGEAFAAHGEAFERAVVLDVGNEDFDLGGPEIHAGSGELDVGRIGVKVVDHVSKLSTESVGLLLLFHSASFFFLTSAHLEGFFFFFEFFIADFSSIFLFFLFSDAFLMLSLLSLLFFLDTSHFEDTGGVGLDDIVCLFGTGLGLVHFGERVLGLKI